MNADVLAAALAAHDAGLCPIRPTADGKKKPMSVRNRGKYDPKTGKRKPGWEAFQRERPIRELVDLWFTNYPGVGIVCGKVSRYLQMFELEGRMLQDEKRMRIFGEALDKHDARETWERMNAGYQESTPAGGLHTMAFVPDHIAGNVVLARCEDNGETHPLIETRGEGGFVVVAPSNGTTHPTGGSWTLAEGGFDTIATITVAEWEALLAAATECNELASSEPIVPKANRLTQPKPWVGDVVGKSWANVAAAHLAATDSVLEILLRHGWTQWHETAEMVYVTRPIAPGETKDGGVSAQIKLSNGRLINYSSSVAEFETWPTYRGDPPKKVPTRSYDAADVLAVYEFGGDRMMALRAVAEAAGIYSAWLAERVHVGETVDLDNENNWADNLLGQVLADELRPQWCYVTAWRQWARWDGRRWATDETEAVHEVARRWMLDLGETVLGKVTSLKDPLLRKVLEYRRASAMENVVKVARRILATEPTVFDTDLHLLNALNGVVDLRTGNLRPHDPALMMTRLAGAAYQPTASHPDVDNAFGCLDPDDVASVRSPFGVAASGHTGGDHLPVLDGQGSNGKTTLILGVAAALGDYAGPVPPELVMKSSREDHPTIKTVLQGLRFAYIEETEEDGGLRLERVKALTGGAPITARRIGGNYYEFQPSYTLVLATNHRPSVNSAEHAAWRRLHLIPFPYRYGTGAEDRPVDVGLRDRLRLGRQQREAMLAAIVAGAAAAYAAGQPDSPVVQWSTGIIEATDEWQFGEDIILRFASDELIFDPVLRVTLREMFARYRIWCESSNRPAGQDKNFARRFEAHDIARNIERIIPQRRVTYVGVGLRDLLPSRTFG